MSARNFLYLCLATLPESLPLLRDGFFSSSDGMIHLYRVFELDRAIRAGIFFPRWFPLSGYGYGLPVLNYYPPLAYYIAEVLNLLGAGYIGSIKLLIALAFIVASSSMFLFSRDLLGAAPAFVAAIAFAYLPYLVSDAYIRGNFPEMLAMALIPFSLCMFRYLYTTRAAKFFVLSSLSFAAIILTHHLTALVAAPLIGAYILFLFAAHLDRSRLLACAGAAFFSLALSAFYWVPAIAELNLVFVGPASLARFVVSRLVTLQQFLAPSLAYVYLPQSDALQHSAGFPQTLAALFVGLIGLLSLFGVSAAFRGATHLDGTTPKQPPPRGLNVRLATLSTAQWHSMFLLALLIASVFMTLDLSAPFWLFVPVLRFMQFPWRFQILAGVSIAFLLGVAARELPIAGHRARAISHSSISLFLIYLALVYLPDRSFPLTNSQVNLLDSNDPDYVVAQMGWSWTREFVPAEVREENVVGPKLGLVSPGSPLQVQVQIELDNLLGRAAHLTATEPTEISLHQFFFSGWQGYVDGIAAPTYPAGPLGLVTVKVPAGDHRVEFDFQETLFRVAMDIISVLALLGIVAWLFLAQRRAWIALAVVVVFLALLVRVQTRVALAAQPVALSAEFGHNAALLGYSTGQQEDAFTVTLEWFALREMHDDFVVSVQLIDSTGRTIAQSDAPTDWGVTPTSRWQKGEMVTDRRAFPLLPRGSYRLVAGVYLSRENGIVNLEAYDRAGNALGKQLELGSINIGN